jgi:hypothetical protein
VKAICPEPLECEAERRRGTLLLLVLSNAIKRRAIAIHANELDRVIRLELPQWMRSDDPIQRTHQRGLTADA